MTFLTFSFLHTHAKFFSTNKTVQNASEDDRTYRYTRDEGGGGGRRQKRGMLKERCQRRSMEMESNGS